MAQPTIRLSDFKANLGRLVRPNRFLCQMYPPQILFSDTGLMGGYDSNEVLEKVCWHLKSTSIPARTIGEYEFKYYGMTYKLTGDTSYGDLTMTFLNTEDWIIRNFFERWQEAIHIVQNEVSQLMPTPSQNTDAADILRDTSIIISQLGLDGEEVAAYKFYSPFPKEVGEIELSMENNDTVEEFTVTFGYSYWTRVK